MNDEHQHHHHNAEKPGDPSASSGQRASTPPDPEPVEGASGEHDHSMHEHAGHGGASTPPDPEPVEEAGGKHDPSMHEHTSTGSQHDGAHADHTGHENLFRRKFWVSLILSIPVILYSMGLQMMTGLTMPAFPGSEWIAPVFGVVVFFYGGLPFLQMAVPEIKNRQPGMMTLISLAISVAFIYSVATLFLPGQADFFWELVTLIDIMLLGHWIEMRSVRQASGALNALAKLMPDTAERILPDGSLETVRASQLRMGDRVL
ncbi:MAG: hypothetical protein WA109_05005, partial [Bellilinea sp.]